MAELNIKDIKELRPLIDLLAFYAAQKNYGYVDRLGNALDEITVYEAIKDALRDYKSLCIDRPEKFVEISIGGKTTKLDCPDISFEVLERTANKFLEYISGKSGSIIIKATRVIAIEALTRGSKILRDLEVQA